MKALFLIFHGLAEHNGISKKILYQVDALRENGLDTKLCYFVIDNDGTQKRMVDNDVLENLGAGVSAKVKKRVCYKSIINYIVDNKVDMLYIRSTHNSNPFLTSMAKRLHKKGVKIVMEIPTYPYEGQYKGAPLMMKLGLYVDVLSRNAMAKYIDRIITFTDLPEIFSVPTINISNGIDFSKIKVKPNINNTTSELHFIGVAELHYWHGFDRMIKGLGEYYRKERELDVYFHIVGEGFGDEPEKLRALSLEEEVADKVIFHGNQSGDKLDELFFRSDMGIASLARHRSNITKIKTLKNREYAARGIPFAYSEIDDDFEKMPYIIKVPANEEPINIDRLIEFYQNQRLTPEQIRSTVSETLSWRVQMKKVIDETFK